MTWRKKRLASLCFTSQHGANGAPLSWFLMWISRKIEKSHAAQLNYMAAQCKRSVLDYVGDVAGPAAGFLKIDHTNHLCMNSAL